jgi:glycosyltransferase involved in cell wall biosynthesis
VVLFQREMSAAPVTVSIITPCYNGARFLRLTLESAVSQTRPPLEIIVIDDGSTDDSAAIAEGVQGPVRVLRQTNQGESVARNRGIAEARGTHLLFLDADDLLEPEALERLTAAIESQPGAVAIMGCAWFEENPAEPYAVNRADQRTFFPAIIASNFAPPHCWLSPIDVIRRAGGFYEPLRWFEDWDLWWRVGLVDPVLIPVDFVGARYRRHKGSQLATTKAADWARGHVVLTERMAAAFLERPEMLERFGQDLFWSSWTAIVRAHQQGVPWSEIKPLADRIVQLSRRGPKGLRTSRMATAIRLVGPRLLARVARTQI